MAAKRIKKQPSKVPKEGKIAHAYPSVGHKGQELKTPFAGGGMVTFKFSKRSLAANERDALRLLNFYKSKLATWQVAKAWYAKGAIQNTYENGGVFKSRAKSQGWAGKGKVVGYSSGKKPQYINEKSFKVAILETQASVKAAVSGTKGDYKENLAMIYQPASFTARGSKWEFYVNVFFERSGLTYYKSQSKLKVK